jgi:RNA polymerase sigma-70 factor (ECF subfamily)
LATFSAITADFFPTPSLPQAVEPKCLLASAKRGDSSAFRALFEAHSKRIYSLCLRIAGGAVDAETLTRNIFVAAFSHLDSIADDGAFARELYRQSAKRILLSRGGKDFQASSI